MKVGLAQVTDIPNGTTRVEEALNEQWQLRLPTAMPGKGKRGFVDFPTVASTDEYDLDVLAETANKIRSLTGPYFINDRQLDVYTNVDDFYEHASRRTNTSEGEPFYVLQLGRVVTLRPVPDVVYTVRAYCLRYNDALPAAGVAISDMLFAKYVWLGAAADIALNDLSDIETSGEALTAQQAALDLIHARYAPDAVDSPPVYIGDDF